MSTVTATATVVTRVAAVTALGYPLRVALRSDRPSARPFAAVLAASTLWAVCILLPGLPGLPAAVSTAWVWEVGRDVGSFAVPVAWLVYVRSYAGRTEWRTPGVTGLAVLSLLAVVATNAPLPQDNPASIVAGLLTIATLLAAVAAFCYGAWVLYRLAGTHDRVSAWQVVTVVAVVATPYLLRFAVGLWALAWFAFEEVPVEQSLVAVPVDEASVGLLLAGVFASAAVRTYPVLSGFPPGEDAPAVELTLAETAGGAELTVADDGPGISDHDLSVLAEGMESQLNHATGLGLWLVQWAVTQLGGEMDVADRDPTGTVVTVRSDT